MSNSNKALVQRWFEEVWNKGRADAVDELLAAESVVHGLGPDLHGPAGFKSFHSAYRNAFPNIAIRVDHMVAEGDMVAVHWSGTGTHLGDGLGFAATNKPVNFTGMVFIRVANGKLAEGWNVFDQLGMLQQIGLVPVRA